MRSPEGRIMEIYEGQAYMCIRHVKLTLILESCGIAQTLGDLGGTVISQTPNSFFFME